MTATLVQVLGSPEWAQRTADLLVDGGVDVPVVAVGAPCEPRRRCPLCHQEMAA